MEKKFLTNRVNKQHNLGFTLVELLVVLTISLTVISITTIAYGKLSSSAYLKDSARHIAASLRYARNYAVARGVESSFNINLANRTYSFSGNNQTYKFKTNINLDVFSAASLSQLNNEAVIRFAPDGS